MARTSVIVGHGVHSLLRPERRIVGWEGKGCTRGRRDGEELELGMKRRAWMELSPASFGHCDRSKKKRREKREGRKTKTKDCGKERDGGTIRREGRVDE